MFMYSYFTYIYIYSIIARFEFWLTVYGYIMPEYTTRVFKSQFALMRSDVDFQNLMEEMEKAYKLHKAVIKAKATVDEIRNEITDDGASN